MQMAVNPATADLVHVELMAPTSASAADVKTKIMNKAVALAVKLTQQAAAGDDVGAAEVPAKRKNDTVGGNSENGGVMTAPLSRNTGSTGSKADRAQRDRLASLGLLSKVKSAPNNEEKILEDKVCAELKKLCEVESGDLTADLTYGGVLTWWKKW
ncbi:unnamed protein product [Discosporangium mesarthrocarpum]